MRYGECAKCGGNLTADHKCPAIYQTRVHVGDEIANLRIALTTAREENERLTAELMAYRLDKGPKLQRKLSRHATGRKLW